MKADYHLNVFTHAFPSCHQPVVLRGSFAKPSSTVTSSGIVISNPTDTRDYCHRQVPGVNTIHLYSHLHSGVRK